ncbi:hypothetical protein IWX90DRAFT_487280 [Phyllosticta citrichinensis]|uniref:Uncharacterized protein n=1 Tax=Phyllosticta citrichinensis TaxID=1130410 RepID=A0ABR1XQQ5_9PEZI
MKSILPLAAVFLAVVHQGGCAVLRPRAENFKLFAYSGEDMVGLTVFASDGLVYAGDSSSLDKSSISNLTISTDDATDSIWHVTVDSSNASSTGYWTIQASDSGLETVSVSTSQDSGTTTGFGLYGAWAYHISSSGDIEMNYRATPTETDGLYLIKWDPTSTTDDSATAVQLRTQSPVPVTKDKN